MKIFSSAFCSMAILLAFAFISIPAQDDPASNPEESSVQTPPEPQAVPPAEAGTEEDRPEPAEPPPQPPPPVRQFAEPEQVPEAASEQISRRRRRRPPQLSEQEREFIERRTAPSRQEQKAPSAKTSRAMAPPATKIKKSTITEMMKVEVVDEPITNLFRLISKTYQINIVPESDLSELRVTINLENITVTEGLKVICNVNGLEMNEVDDVLYIRKASEKTIAEMSLYSTRIDINVENKPVKDFIREFAEKTRLSIVPDQGLDGKVTGHLTSVLPIEGFKALMSVNNFQVRERAGIIRVQNMEDDVSGGAPLRGRRSDVRRGGPVDVNVSNGKVTASLNSAELKDAVRAIADQTDLNMITYGEIDGRIDAEFRDIPVNKALSMLLQGTRNTFIIKDGIMLIGERNPKSPSGAILSTAELHNLKFIRADDAAKLLPKHMNENVTVVNEQNAILINGTAEVITQVKEFLEQVDLPVPQVLLEVIIVEYDRSTSSEFGISSGSGPTDVPNISGAAEATGIPEASFTAGDFKGAIKVLPQNWMLHLKANLQREKGKVLSMPKITTENGKKAHLRVRRTFYHPVTSFNKDGFQSTDFRAIDDGITIDLQPWVTRHGDISLEIKPSIKTSGISDDPERPAPVTDRAITTNVRLLDGETLILGGLIDSKEKVARRHVPILGYIPILGWLFSARTKYLQTMELVIYVTPHILPETGSGVDLEEQLEGLDERSGFVDDKDFLQQYKKNGGEEDTGSESDNTAPEAVPQKSLKK